MIMMQLPGAIGSFPDSFHKRADHLVADVGLQERLLDELQPVAHVRLGQLPLATERLEGGAEVLLKGVEHAERGESGACGEANA